MAKSFLTDNLKTRGLLIFAALSTVALIIMLTGSSGGMQNDPQPIAGFGAPVIASDNFQSSLLFSSSRLLGFPNHAPSPAREVRVPILMYHHVGQPPPWADELRISLTVPEQDFRAQMDYLAAAGYKPISQAQLFMALYYGALLPAKPVMLTFDDGYADNYHTALPVLESHGFDATFYLATAMIGREDYMTWDQATDIANRGLDIGSHTVFHTDLTAVTPDEAQDELRQSAAEITSRTGLPVRWFCYPAGKYNADVEKLVGESGYFLATTTETGEVHSSNAPFALTRYRISADTSLEGFMLLVE